MILSKAQIQKAVQKGELRIEPFTETHLKGASYTFTLSPRLLLIGSGQILRPDTEITYVETTIAPRGFLLESKQFAVGFTREKLTLNNTFACQLSTRGSCAQMGLSVLLSDTFCEPDTDNVIALAIHNASQLPIMLFPGMLIVKGVFFRLGKSL